MENLQPFLISLGLLSVGGIGLIFYKDKEFGLSLKTDDTIDEDDIKNDYQEENTEETFIVKDKKKNNKKRPSRSTTLSNKKKTNQHKNTKRNRIMS
jgi:hypothetical protein